MKRLIDRYDYRDLQRFNETTLVDVAGGGVSNLTQFWLDERNSGVTKDAKGNEIPNRDTLYLLDSIYSVKDDFLEISFWADSTYRDKDNQIEYDVVKGPNDAYIVVLRFYAVTKKVLGMFNRNFFQPERLKATPYSKIEKVIYKIIQNCDIKFYSNDPSFYYQGVWEDLEKENMSIYRFIGPRGKGIWHDRHAESGGLFNSNIHVTKHIAQACFEINQFVPEVVKNLKVITNNNMATEA
jgi:hypothetical protein